MKNTYELSVKARKILLEDVEKVDSEYGVKRSFVERMEILQKGNITDKSLIKKVAKKYPSFLELGKHDFERTVRNVVQTFVLPCPTDD
ncbi:hypothetical protein [Staphylococcus chromogenes]|uniref:hypothetical protein n=1 Tax=Staphylococcus chromogenes TaxID=46126 RepID=UPI00188F1CEB|nr:hypothetical protein [Staphylococcus chromogenes]HDF3152206.1 hypothetical protein [Staphylococcus aureus]